MDLLKRRLAPILPEAWELIDAEATRVLALKLGGRKVVDFSGPLGWKYAAVNTGRLTPLSVPNEDIALGLRRVQPLVEVRVPIKLAIMELDTVARGAEDPDLGPVVETAKKAALVEDNAIFNGLERAGIVGIIPSSPHPVIPLPTDVRLLAPALLEAKELLRRAGIGGPYVLVLGSVLHEQVFAATDDGHPIAKRIEQQLVDRPIVRSDAVEGAVLMSVRGGDYELTVGQDLSIGYAFHSKHEVELYLTESFTFRVLEPAAAVRIAAPV
ncbi:MAG TPA: family 1 encapsulin nanocompartment shell protein [Labilithrix sp.]|nr:family 1 encapsulin nanocompartment shell protein [Labilithrix sp.]